MKKIFALGAMLTASVAFTEVAEAQNYQRQGYGYNQQYRGGGNYYRNNGNRYVQNNYYGGRRGGGWNGNNAAWALGGLAVGAILGGALAAPAYGAYAAPAYGYAPPAPVYVPSCWRQPVYNPAGYQIGWQQVCQ